MTQIPKISSNKKGKKYPFKSAKEKSVRKMTLEELKVAEVFYTERIAVLESKRVCNGGIGLLPDRSQELSTRRSRLKIIKELLAK